MPKAPRFTRLSSLSPRRRALAGALIGLAVGLIFHGLRSTTAVERLERRLVDARSATYLGDRKPDDDIVLAVVSDADAANLEQDEHHWPWSLELTSYAFDWMAEAGVRVVAVDMFQLTKGAGPEEVASDQPRTHERAVAEAAEAELLGDAYSRVRNVVLAMQLLREGSPPVPRTDAVRKPELERHLARLPSIQTRTLFRRPNVNLPVVRLLRKAATVGYAEAEPDLDGILRRATPVAILGNRAVLSLTAATAMLAVAGDVQFESDWIRFEDAKQSLDSRGSFLVNFRGPRDSYRQVRPADMVRAGSEVADWRAGGRKGPLPEVGSATVSRVRGKNVVRGVDFGGFKDKVPTPADTDFPGPEWQATVIDNLLHGDGRVPAEPESNRNVLLGLATLLGLIGGATRNRLTFLGAFAVLLTSVFLLGYKLFAAGHSWDLVTPAAALVFTYAGVNAFQAVTEGRRNKWLEVTFGQYLSPAVIEALKQDPKLLTLGGKRRELSILFSDVKGFTGISEKLESDDLVKLLNDYLTRQSAKVLDEDGVIDKFVGDAVVAFFGDPVPAPDHAIRACRAALRSIAAVPETEPLAKSLGVNEFVNRIGVESGTVVVGNMGSEKRFNYTVMGDTVNLASRLEGANKEF